jgi:beta-glucosidase
METAAKFARYCQKATQHLGDLIDVVCTINEVNVPRMAAMIWMAGGPGETFIRQAAEALHTIPEQFAPFLFAGTALGRDVILAAHHQARAAIKAERPSLPVGLTVAMSDMQAVPGGETVRDQMRWELQDVFLEAARQDDFIGVQTYTRERYGSDGALSPEEGVELTQMGYEFWPEAIGATLRRAYEVTGLPLMVTENGIGTADDGRRLAYYQTALQSVADCLRDGLDIRGYFAWSAFDNFEWMLGYEPTFGIIAVDRATQRRSPKPSAHWLSQVVQANRLV